MWIMLLIIFVAGSVGGIVNALLSDNGFIMPKSEQFGKRRVWRPGYLGNILVGAVAACVSWGLYGPLATVNIFGGTSPTPENATLTVGLSLSSLVGAALVGVAGAKWLTNEVDKKLLEETIRPLAVTLEPEAPNLVDVIEDATPAEAAEIAHQEANAIAEERAR